MAAPFKLKQSFSIFGGDNEESSAPARKTPAETRRPSFLDEDRDNELSFGFTSDTPGSHQYERHQPQAQESQTGRASNGRFAFDSTRPRFAFNQTPKHNAPSRDTTTRTSSDDSTALQNSHPNPSQDIPSPQQDTARPARSSSIPPGSPQTKVQRSHSATPPDSPHLETHPSVFSTGSPQTAYLPPASPPATLDPNPHPNFQSSTGGYADSTTQQESPQRKRFQFTTNSAANSRRSFQFRGGNKEQQPSEALDRGRPSEALDKRQSDVTVKSNVLFDRTQTSDNEQAHLGDAASKVPRNFKFTSFKPQFRFKNTETERFQGSLKEHPFYKYIPRLLVLLVDSPLIHLMSGEVHEVRTTEMAPVETSNLIETTPVEPITLEDHNRDKEKEVASVPRFPRFNAKASRFGNSIQPKTFNEEQHTHAPDSRMNTLALHTRTMVPSRQPPPPSGDPREAALKNIDWDLEEAKLKQFNEFCAFTRAELSSINQETHKELTEMQEKLVELSIVLAQQTQELILLRDPVLEYKIATVTRKYHELEKELARGMEE